MRNIRQGDSGERWLGGGVEGGIRCVKIFINKHIKYLARCLWQEKCLKNTLSLPSIPRTDASSLLRLASAEGDQADSGQGSTFFMGG